MDLDKEDIEFLIYLAVEYSKYQLREEERKGGRRKEEKTQKEKA